MNKRIVLAAAASAVALASVVGVALGVGHDEPRLVRTAGVSAPLEESTSSTSMAPAAETAKVAELDATVDNHETRLRVLESTTTTVPATATAPVASSPVAPAAEPEPTTTTTIVVSTTMTTQAAPTTTTTRWLSAGMCPADHHTGLNPDGVYCAAPPAS